MAWSSAILLLLTGFYKTPINLIFNFTSGYTTILSVKLIFFALMIIFGVIISAVLVPKMNKLLPKPGEKPSDEFITIQKNINILSKINLLLGLGILFCIALLRT